MSGSLICKNSNKECLLSCKTFPLGRDWQWGTFYRMEEPLRNVRVTALVVKAPLYMAPHKGWLHGPLICFSQVDFCGSDEQVSSIKWLICRTCLGVTILTIAIYDRKLLAILESNSCTKMYIFLLWFSFKEKIILNDIFFPVVWDICLSLR